MITLKYCFGGKLSKQLCIYTEQLLNRFWVMFQQIVTLNFICLLFGAGQLCTVSLLEILRWTQTRLIRTENAGRKKKTMELKGTDLSLPPQNFPMRETYLYLLPAPSQSFFYFFKLFMWENHIKLNINHGRIFLHTFKRVWRDFKVCWGTKTLVKVGKRW